MRDSRQCSRCNGLLYVGFLKDVTDRGGVASAVVMSWVPGPAEKGLFGGAKVLGKEQFDVVAYCCEDCGHLDLFLE